MGAFGNASDVIRNQIFVGRLYVDGGLKTCWSSVMKFDTVIVYAVYKSCQPPHLSNTTKSAGIS